MLTELLSIALALALEILPAGNSYLMEVYDNAARAAAYTVKEDEGIYRFFDEEGLEIEMEKSSSFAHVYTVFPRPKGPIQSVDLAPFLSELLPFSRTAYQRLSMIEEADGSFRLLTEEPESEAEEGETPRDVLGSSLESSEQAADPPSETELGAYAAGEADQETQAELRTNWEFSFFRDTIIIGISGRDLIIVAYQL